VLGENEEVYIGSKDGGESGNENGDISDGIFLFPFLHGISFYHL